MAINREFKGDCMGVRLVSRGPTDHHICFEVMVEDDGLWHSKMYASSAWLDELIEVLTSARASMKHHTPDRYKDGKPDSKGRQYGWRFK